MEFELVIGNKNYSSWSLRAWLHLRSSGIEFEETRIPLFIDGWKEKIRRYSEAGRVPVLRHGDVTVWDTMAISAYVLDVRPDAVGWPEDLAARAVARSLAAEMHAGFLDLRAELPQNLRLRRRRERGSLSDAAQAQIARIEEMWSTCRREYAADGPWLFGRFSLADVVYAPVALRFVTYQIPLAEPAQSFVEAVRAHRDVEQFGAEAEAEEESLPFIDDLEPVGSGPMSLG